MGAPSFGSRLRLWMRMIRDVRGRGPKDELALVLSAARDLAATLGGRAAPSIRVGRDLTVLVPSLGSVFHVRGGTDDLYHVLPLREDDVHRAILDALGKGDTFVDGGANIGYYTVQAAQRVGPAGRVIAIEPIPATRAVLEQNLAVNGVAGSVSIAGAAIGAEAAGTVRLSVARGMYGMGSRATPPGTETFDVEATTLDELCRDLARISMLKLDVEGAELDALRGAGRTLSRTRAVVVECNENAREIEELLVSAGFSVRKLRFSTYVLAERAA